MNFLKKNKWLVVVLFFFIGAYAAYQYAYKPHKTTEELTADFSGTTTDFLSKVQENFNEWNNKAVELSGEITAKDENGITLNNQIYCQFRNDIDFSALKTNQPIKIKGRVIGYDDLLEELKLDKCILK